MAKLLHVKTPRELRAEQIEALELELQMRKVTAWRRPDITKHPDHQRWIAQLQNMIKVAERQQRQEAAYEPRDADFTPCA